MASPDAGAASPGVGAVAAAAAGGGAGGGAGGAAPLPAAAAVAAPAAVKVNLKPIGSAPALSKNKFKVPAEERFATVIAFLRRQLGLRDGDSLLCYLHSAFAPTPAQLIGDLFRSFESDGELVVHYSLAAAYG
jgi:ubiquitin-like protein ATG12